MYKVLVVDDEKPARETLGFLIDWSKTPYRIVESACNGAEALKKYNLIRPDLVFTDIQMPVMDGLEFIKKVRLIEKDQKFVILSCHESFKYAREAIKLGVSDYLLKDLLTAGDLYDVLEKVRFELEKTTADKSVNMELTIVPEVDENKAAILKDIVFGNKTEEQVKTAILHNSLGLSGNYFVLMYVMADDYVKLSNGISFSPGEDRNCQILCAIQDSLDTMLGGECFSIGTGQYVVIACVDDINSQFRFSSDCHSICQKIRSKVTQIANLSLTIGISKGFRYFAEVNDRYLEAFNAAKQKIYMGRGKNLFYSSKVIWTGSINPDYIDKKLNIIKSLMEEKNSERLIKEISLIFNDKHNGFIQYNYLKYIVSWLFSIIIEYCRKHDIGCFEVFGCGYVPFEKPDEMETQKEISEWFAEIFLKAVKVQTGKNEKKFSRRVKEAIEFMQSNYDADIGLEEVAEALFLHKGYLCRLFKQETGFNITDYIINLRIEKAKQLIDSTNYKLYEIAEKSGFTNARQFSLTFKKNTGLTPAEFRENRAGSSSNAI